MSSPARKTAERLGKPLRSGALVATIAALAIGCGDPASSPAVDGASSPAARKEFTLPLPAAVAMVTDPGGEPRDIVGLRVAPGQQQQVLLRTTTQVRQQIDAQPDQDFSSPALTIPLTALPDANGVKLTLGKIVAADAGLTTRLASSEGSTAGLATNPHGGVTALRISPDPDADDEARKAIEQALYQAVYQAITFPDKPIGLGAVWTIRQQVDGSVELDQVTTARLAARTGNRLTVTVHIEQQPRSAVWSLPNNAGVLNIDSYVMRGSGTVTVDLGMPLPVSGNIVVAGEQSYSDPGGASRLKQFTRNQVQWGE